MRKVFVLYLACGFLIANVSSGVAASPQLKSEIQMRSMILAPGPITPTPISARQVCQTVQTVMGLTGFWQSLGNRISIWITIPVYGSSIICTNYFF